MIILFLTNSKAELANQIPDFLKLYGDTVIIKHDRVYPEFMHERKIEFIVSDRYEFILKDEVLKLVNYNAINLHPSYLPWNKGYHPNFWSIYDDTIKGVSIHKIDPGIDTGKIYVQKKINFEDDDTLKTSYYKSRTAIVSLLFENWINIRNQKIKPLDQEAKGTHHFKKEFDVIWENFKDGWDTPIIEQRKIKQQLKKKN